MATLMDRYLEGRSELGDQIAKATTWEQIVGVIRGYFAELSDASGDYFSDLTKPEARVAARVLGIVSSVLDALIAATMQGTATTGDRQKSPQYDSSGPTVTVHRNAERPTPKGTMLRGLERRARSLKDGVAEFISTWRAGGTSNARIRQRSRASVGTTNDRQGRDKTDSVLFYLERAFDMVDRTVAEYGRHMPNPPKSRLEDHPEILQFLQNLIGDSDRLMDQLPSALHDRLREIPSILRHYSIRAERYREAVVGADDMQDMFEFEPSFDPNLDEYVTLLPAPGDNVRRPG